MPTDPTPPPPIRFARMDTLVTELLVQLNARDGKPELPTGLAALDEAIWGLNRGEITVVAARPGEGKSSLSLQIAGYLAERKKRVIFVSLEMTVHQLVERWLVQLTQTDAWSLRTGHGVSDFTQRLAPLNGFFKEIPLRYVDDYGETVSELSVMLQECEKNHDLPDLLILDYIQMIEDDEEGSTDVQAIKRYLRKLKRLAAKYHMAVLVCSQINREGGRTKSSSRPRLIHLKGSGSIEEIADCVLMLWWQELGTEEKPQGTAYWICVEKQRYGSPGQMVAVHFDQEKLTFKEASAMNPDFHEPATDESKE